MVYPIKRNCRSRMRGFVARCVRNHTDHPFDQHKLAAVVYLMFLDAKDHFESRFLFARFHCDAFVEKIRRQAFQPLGEEFAARA